MKSGAHMLQKLWALETTKDVALEWESVHNGIQIISNHITPSHCDTNGQPEWFNLLASFTGGGSIPHFLVKDLGLDFEYSSRTVVGLCGATFEHEVQAWGGGDRACYPHFLQEAVQE
jgi:hypothetical protein